MLRYNFNNSSSLCARQFGSSFAGSRYLFSRTELRNFVNGEGVSNRKAGIPNGHLDPSSWLLPQEPGGMSSYRELQFAFSTSLLVGTEGPMTGNVSFSFSHTASLNAVGYITGGVTPFTELSPKTLADAVWNAQKGDYIQTNSMGKTLVSTKTNSDLIPALV